MLYEEGFTIEGARKRLTSGEEQSLLKRTPSSKWHPSLEANLKELLYD
jgi:hypothetical protein